MSTMREWLLVEAGGEAIEAVVIGPKGWERDVIEDWQNKVLTWDAAAPLLSYEFDSGFGSPQCHAVTAWTKSWVIGVSQYDGSTDSFRMPRHPVDHQPVMPGG